MESFVLKVGNIVLTCIYAALKLFPADAKKVLFLSRQTNEPSLDFTMLQDELRLQDPDVRIVSICNRIAQGPASKVSFAYDTLRSLFHLATSRVCVMDSYWPAVSVLHHKRSLTVVQIWHALGKVKQSGWQTVGKPGGRSLKIARMMHMHEGYDYIVGGAPIWNPCYCASFGCKESQILNLGLPRMDYLIHSKQEVANKVFARYPELKGKIVVLYAPTFRRGKGVRHDDSFAALDAKRFALVVKGHPNQRVDVASSVDCPEFEAIDLLCVADYLITDYSAIALEGAVANVRTLYYLYDYDDYRRNNGLNIDIAVELPECVYFDAGSLIEGLLAAVEGAYPEEAFQSYCERFLIGDRGHSTKDIAAFVLKERDQENRKQGEQR